MIDSSEELAKTEKTPAGKPSTTSLMSMFWSFFKIGAFTFGGGWAMIPLIRKELVSKRGWLDDSEFLQLLAIAQSTPGPVAVNTSIITGYEIRGIPGALAAALGSSLPPFLVILAFATVLMKYRGSGAVEAVFKGMRPAIFGLLVSAVWQVGRSSVKSKLDIGFAVAAGILLLALNVNPIIVVILAAAAGVLLGRLYKESGRPETESGEFRTPGEDD